LVTLHADQLAEPAKVRLTLINGQADTPAAEPTTAAIAA
jgi:hypothetical protein